MYVARGAPEVPPAGQHLWEWFWDLHRGRQASVDGWLSLTAAEMRAWSSLTGNIVTLQEWQMLRDMDSAFLAAARRRAAGDQTDHHAKAAPMAGNGQDISAAAFDAVFG